MKFSIKTALAVSVWFFGLQAVVASTQTTANNKPKVVIGIVVENMRPDYAAVLE